MGQGNTELSAQSKISWLLLQWCLQPVFYASLQFYINVCVCVYINTYVFKYRYMHAYTHIHISKAVEELLCQIPS